MKHVTLKISALLVILLLSLFVLISCNSLNNPPAGESTSESVSTEPGEVTEEQQNQLVIVSDHTANYRVIRSELAEASSGSVLAAVQIRTAIENATGVKPELGTDFVMRGQSTDSSTYEILVGADVYPEFLEAQNELLYSGYRICIVGNKIVVASFSDDAYAEAAKVLCQLIAEKGSEGSLILEKTDLDISGSVESLAIVDALPLYLGGDKPQLVDLADNNHMLYIKNTSLEEYQTYCNKLSEFGFTKYTSREVQDNHFATYTSENSTVNCYYTAYEKATRIVTEPTTALPPLENPSYTKVCDPTVSMVGLEFYGKDSNGVYNQIGLFMVWRLSDGRFIVVDGGGYTDAMISKIYTTLSDLAVDKDNITVAAWLFTHAHGDHTGGFIKFANHPYSKRVKVENFIFNFTTNEQYDAIDDGADRGRADQCRTAARNYPGANIIKAHTGQVFHFADATLEMLFTFDDVQPKRLTFHNTTSLVFRVTIDNKSVMVLGDAYTVTNNILVKMYGDYLKSDICEIAHHGYVGGTVQVYTKIDPDYVLWTGGAHAYATLKTRDYNAFVLNQLHVKRTYVAGSSLYTFNLPAFTEITAQ